MVGVVTARDIAGWEQELTALTDGLSWLFNRPESKRVFADFVRALLADVPKKNSWGLAEHVGYPTPRPFEHLLGGAVWDADLLRDAVRALVVDRLGSPEAVLVVDDTQALKKGTRSVGVAPQYYGLTGDVANVQTMVMCTYASEHGHAFTDRELYLPEVWTDDPARCRAAGVPAGCRFATKPRLAVEMLARAVEVGTPFRWVAADSGYGKDPGLRGFCHDRRLSYVLAVPKSLPLLDARGRPTRPDRLHARLPAGVFERRSCGAGAKGVRWYDWAALAVAVAVADERPADGHALLVRKSVAPRTRDGKTSYEFEYFLVHAPAPTGVPDMVRAAGARWTVEEDNGQGKDALGLDQYQVRKWTPWHRHVTINMLAHAFLAATRADLGKGPPDPGDRRLIRHSTRSIRRLLATTLLAARHTLPDNVLARELRRMAHQNRTLLSHYRRRGDLAPLVLRV
ncbi:transposase [Frankia sp. Hr75.2]|nr:transposase [Frankia sp. Hr75.2]